MDDDFILTLLPYAKDLPPDIREGIYEFLRRVMGLPKPDQFGIHEFMNSNTGEYKIPSAKDFLTRHSIYKLNSEIKRLHKTISAHQIVLEKEKNNLETLKKIKADIEQIFGVYEEAKKRISRTLGEL